MRAFRPKRPMRPVWPFWWSWYGCAGFASLAYVTRWMRPLIPSLRDESDFLMMNGDVLTTIDYAKLLSRHRESGAEVTIATYRRDVKIDFGVIETDAQDLLTGYVEKPRFDYRVSMGIYCFKAQVLQDLQPGEYRDFPDLVKSLLAAGRKVASYPFDGYWLDMGRPDDYATAIEEFESRRDEFLPRGAA